LQSTSAIDSKQEALNFINKYGFVTLFPIRGTNFSSLYQATIGTREEKFKKAWQWADELSLGQKQIYYCKFIGRQVTLISMEMLPYFYRLFKRREFTGTSAEILALIKKRGAVSTTDLKKSLRLTGPDKRNEFSKAADLLQKCFVIAIISKGEPPRHAHTWDLMENWMPEEALKMAESIGEEVAKQKIVQKLLDNHVLSGPEDAEKFLGL